MFVVARLLFQPTKRLNRAYIFATRCGLIYDREEEGFLLLASCLASLLPDSRVRHHAEREPHSPRSPPSQIWLLDYVKDPSRLNSHGEICYFSGPGLVKFKFMTFFVGGFQFEKVPGPN